MKAKKIEKDSGVDYVRMDKTVVEKVREHKKKTGVAIGKFFEIAAIEKLKRSK